MQSSLLKTFFTSSVYHCYLADWSRVNQLHQKLSPICCWHFKTDFAFHGEVVLNRFIWFIILLFIILFLLLCGLNEIFPIADFVWGYNSDHTSTVSALHSCYKCVLLHCYLLGHSIIFGLLLLLSEEHISKVIWLVSVKCMGFTNEQPLQNEILLLVVLLVRSLFMHFVWIDCATNGNSPRRECHTHLDDHCGNVLLL